MKMDYEDGGTNRATIPSETVNERVCVPAAAERRNP